jgi:hypothetical protein
MPAGSSSVCRASIKDGNSKFPLAVFVLALTFSISAYAALENGRPADIVIGQRNFESNSASVTSQALSAPYTVWTDGTKMAIADFGNSRVLLYNSIPKTNFAAADVVLGQVSFTANVGGFAAGPSALNFPVGITSAGSRFIVADTFNNRILIWNQLPTRNAQPADIVLGKPNFISGGAGLSQRDMTTPRQIMSDGTRLFIPESVNNRVLIYLSIPTSNYAPADLVLGQPGFTTNTANNGGLSARSISTAFSVYYDGQKLFVSDQSNNRVLIFNSLPSENFAAADVVVGQPNFTTNAAGSAPSKLNSPLGVYSDGASLYVVDSGNHRILVWKKIPAVNGEPADFVIGQPGFSTLSGSVTQNTINTPFGVTGSGRQLFVADQGNNRVLFFNLAEEGVTELGPQFEQGKAVLGKVFEDKNSNGRQDRDEKGIEGVKIASDTGIYAITDEDGKYHFPFIQLGQRVLKIDESTLPDGAQITTESPRKVVVTKGILTKVSFGIKLSSGVTGYGSDGVTPKLRNTDTPLLKVSMSQDPAALEPRLGISARQEDAKIIFTIDCNYFLFVERAELKIFNADHKLFKTIELGKPIPYEYEMPLSDLSSPNGAIGDPSMLDSSFRGNDKNMFYYQLSVFNTQGREDRTNLGEITVV